jgi:hypothetical protein
MFAEKEGKDHYLSGNLAIFWRPMAFRPRLATGLAFSDNDINRENQQPSIDGTSLPMHSLGSLFSLVTPDIKESLSVNLWYLQHLLGKRDVKIKEIARHLDARRHQIPNAAVGIIYDFGKLIKSALFVKYDDMLLRILDPPEPLIADKFALKGFAVFLCKGEHAGCRLYAIYRNSHEKCC